MIRSSFAHFAHASRTFAHGNCAKLSERFAHFAHTYRCANARARSRRTRGGGLLRALTGFWTHPSFAADRVLVAPSRTGSDTLAHLKRELRALRCAERFTVAVPASVLLPLLAAVEDERDGFRVLAVRVALLGSSSTRRGHEVALRHVRALQAKYAAFLPVLEMAEVRLRDRLEGLPADPIEACPAAGATGFVKFDKPALADSKHQFEALQICRPDRPVQLGGAE